MENELYTFKLKKIVDSCGSEVFLDREKLESELKSVGIEDKTILQMLLLTTVPGFRELLQTNDASMENDLDRFVGNAQDTTGLDRNTILDLTVDIASALGYYSVASQYQYNNAKKAGRTFVVPFRLYEKELAEIRKKLNAKQNLTESDLNSLTGLCDEGIPEAQFYMSRYLEENNQEAAENLLIQAASQNCGEAQAALGDLHYSEMMENSWEKAHECYTGYGAIALNRTRRNRLKNILNHKIYNLKLLQKSFLILLAMLCLLFFKVPGGMLGTNSFVGILFLLMNAGVWAAAVYHYTKHPYAFLKWLIPAMSGIWGIYLIIWIL
ncbi:MAG: hypothetical protein U0O33_11910 [Blautia sp.]